MTDPTYASSDAPIRQAILVAHRNALRRIANPGTWFDGSTRVAIAAETRNAMDCSLCADRKAALSPYTIEGNHNSLGELQDSIIEIIHRIVTDPARLKRQWHEDVLASGTTDTEYVEVVGVVCTMVSIDTFARAIGLPRLDLPAPEPGAPPRHRPTGVKPSRAWVPWIAPEDVTEAEADLYDHGSFNIRRALTAVPDEQRGFFDLVNAQYLSSTEIWDFTNENRAITRAQIELLAGRVSALNQCVY